MNGTTIDPGRLKHLVHADALAVRHDLVAGAVDEEDRRVRVGGVRHRRREPQPRRVVGPGAEERPDRVPAVEPRAPAGHVVGPVTCFGR